MGTPITGLEHREILDVLIVGAGFGGIGMAINLLKAGINRFMVLEKSDDVGGTWHFNSYPGCACDVQSHLYSFSFAPKHDWTKRYAPWHEIKKYIVDTVEQYQLRPFLQFHQEVSGCHFNPKQAVWTVKSRSGQSWQAHHVVIASGPLHVPHIPQFPGIEQFQGTIMHSAQWDHNQSLIGKRVASIGTGASAIQYIPKIAPRVRQLDVYQRTPAWVLPRDERHYLSIEKKLFERFPVWRKLHRARLYWSNESRLLPIMTPAISKIGAEALKASIKLQVRDAQTAQKLTPDYALGCKRILISNTYYPTFNQPHVALITDGIQSIHANSIVDSQGIERPTDCIVFGTGFIVDPRIYMRDFSCTGLPGHDLMQDWKDASEAYYGMAVHGFPNMWQLVGPNSGLGHNSILFMIEAQVRYIIECMHLLRQQGSDFMHVRPEVQKQFNDKVQEQANKTVWASGCTSWYQQADGRNFAIWPWSTWKFWLETRRVNPNAFIFGQATATTKKVKHSIRQESVM